MDLIFDKKMEDLIKALKTLETALAKKNLEPDEYRDILVIRFLYTSETFGKVIQNYLREIERVEVKFIVDGYRKARGTGLLSPEETEIALEMIGDRNFCAHAYQEVVIDKISKKVPQYAKFMRTVLNRLTEKK